MFKSTLKPTSQRSDIKELSEVEISKILGGIQEQVSEEPVREISCIYDRQSGKTYADVNGAEQEIHH